MLKILVCRDFYVNIVLSWPILVTSAKEVMFLPDCLFVCLSVSKITQKVMDGSF